MNDRRESASAAVIHVRPEFVVDELPEAAIGDVARRLSLIERLWNVNGVRKATILLGLVVFWQLYTVIADVEPLMFPRFTSAAVALWDSLVYSDLLQKIWFSVSTLLIGYAVGMALSAALVFWATASRIGGDFLSTCTAMFNPLPAIALLPLAMLWFGLGTASIVFVTIHSVLWAVSLSTHSGFRSVSETLRMIGRNYGLRGVGYVTKILIPAALPSILAGMKIGWAFAWRTLIGAELVFGASSGSGGLGWFVYENSQNLETAHVFAGLFTVILIGIMVENVIFRNVELRTVYRWGLQR
ncbi:MAG: ABC transporter permease [Gammaproteobacteria bacterium]|nr:ABC transporter permease [Gammaproteobacteria bacterium]